MRKIKVLSEDETNDFFNGLYRIRLNLASLPFKKRKFRFYGVLESTVSLTAWLHSKMIDIISTVFDMMCIFCRKMLADYIFFANFATINSDAYGSFETKDIADIYRRHNRHD